jgi:hypothetical protein
LVTPLECGGEGCETSTGGFAGGGGAVMPTIGRSEAKTLLLNCSRTRKMETYLDDLMHQPELLEERKT